MSSGQSHDHDHLHDHGPDHEVVGTSPALDLTMQDADLPDAELGRRNFLRSAGLLGAGVATAAVLGAWLAAAGQDSPSRSSDGGYAWLAGDHHIHTDIVAARAAFNDQVLVFQGLEWNIPSAEHGTVFVHPGRHEVAVLKEFEKAFGGLVNGWADSGAANEQHALDGLDFLAGAVAGGRVRQALFLANHPARKVLDSPHEIHGWRDRDTDCYRGTDLSFWNVNRRTTRDTMLCSTAFRPTP
jgi:hypothetical protein